MASRQSSTPTLDALRQFAVSRSLFQATDAHDVIARFGFLQADPIRSPARAQDLTLRHRVPGYRAGDLERHYATLPIEEAFFVNYGFVTKQLHSLMHPRGRIAAWGKRRRTQAQAILAFVRERGSVHPREVDAHFAHGRVTNYWGGSSNASTHMLDQLHYLGLLRVTRREVGIRVYGPLGPDDAPLVRLPTPEIDARLDGLIDVIVEKYAPLPWQSLAPLVRRLRYAVPQWAVRLPHALQRAKARLAHARVDGVDWYWPADATIADDVRGDVRLLAPFDPIVWDRRRFEILWGWAYRFEAYTPVAKRQFGYYALPLLWRDRVIGWGNTSVTDGVMRVEFGFVSGKRPRDRNFTRELDAEIERLRRFLDLEGANAKRRQD